MENLYHSLFEDLFSDDDHSNTPNYESDIIKTISGQSDLQSLSKYYNIDEFTTASKTIGHHYLNILHINIRSIKYKIDTLKAFIHSLPKTPDILAITETWLNDTNKTQIQLDGYISHHLVRTNREHGGISLFIKDNLDAELLEQHTFINDDLEICTIKLKTPNMNYLISTIYRPHSKHEQVSEFTTILNNLLLTDTFKNNNTIILGDLNVNLLEHSTHPPTNNFLNTMQSLNYFPHISRPTRFPDNPLLSQPSLLDHIWTNFLPFSLSGIIHIGLSDHLPIFINIPQSIDTDKKHEIRFRIFKNQNHTSFTNDLATLDWSNVLNFQHHNHNFDMFMDKINKLYNKHYPIKTKFISTNRLRKPWITSGILASIKHKCNLFKLSKLGLVSEEFYKRYRNQVSLLIKISKSNYYNNIFTNFKSNTKKIWQTIRELSNKTNSKCKVSTLNHNGTTLKDPKDIAEALNNYFCNIAPELDCKLPPSNINPIHYLKGNYQNSMYIPLITEGDTIEIIKSLKNKKSNINDIAVSVIKKNSSLFAKPLTLLFNQSISTGTFPNALKLARVTPLHKSGSTNNPQNYRPISNLNVFSKIFELLMKKHLMNYLDTKNILNPSQFGFRRNHNTFQALNLFSTDIFSALDNGKSVLSIFIDFSKAFDTVNHGILLNKMYHYGIRGSIHSWFKNYLSNRHQTTIVSGETSSIGNISLGVPQGSVLGPILFLIYINDISNIFLNSKTILFADDMTLYLIGHSPENLISIANQELKLLSQWCISNRLTINTNKTYYMLFTNKKHQTLPPLIIHNETMTRTDRHKFLGITYDETMTFKQHINSLTLKISRHIALLHQLKDFVPLHTLKCIYHAHIYPLLQYCNPIWSTTYPTHLNSLNIQLKKIVRIITGSDYLEHSLPLFKQTHLLNLVDINKMSLATHMYQERTNNMNPTITHTHNTRFRNLPRPPPHHLSLFCRSVPYQAPTIWNTIPSNIQNSPSLQSFKKKLKKHFLNLY